MRAIEQGRHAGRRARAVDFERDRRVGFIVRRLLAIVFVGRRQAEAAEQKVGRELVGTDALESACAVAEPDDYRFFVKQVSPDQVGIAVLPAQPNVRPQRPEPRAGSTSGSPFRP